jgi:DNA polymerase-1
MASDLITNGGLKDLPVPNYSYIKTMEEAYRALEVIERYPIVEFDSETTGLDPLTDKIVLMQFGITGKSYVFDVRKGNVDASIFKALLESPKHLKLIQNSIFDVEMVYSNFGIMIKRLYDTMLAEQLILLGFNPRANLQHLVAKYLKLLMPKDVATSFADYDQEYTDYQLRYAANDVVVLREIYNQQMDTLIKDSLVRVMKLECEFVEPLAGMELSGILLSVPQWQTILDGKIIERDRLRTTLYDILNTTVDQTTLFDVSLLNLDSPTQVVKSLNSLGIPITTTDVKELSKFKSHPAVKSLLEYRKFEKFVTTYGDALMNRIHKDTGRLHTSFRQMVDTGRLSSSNPNLQNIPKEQIYRSCFIAKPGYKLITVDMSQAELRILADYSKDPVFLDAYRTGQDLHIRTAMDVFNKTLEEIKQDEAYKKAGDARHVGYRNKTKAVNFGLMYGLTAVGLAIRLNMPESEAQDLIDRYFAKYKKVKQWLDNTARDAVRNRYSTTISGRRRYYHLPPPSDVTFKRVKGSVERAAKNHPIQGSNADTVKQAMIFVNDRLKGKDAKLILTVHDEVIVETREDIVEEVAPIVTQAVIDGFADFFHTIPMEADAMIGDCWLKG